MVKKCSMNQYECIQYALVWNAFNMKCSHIFSKYEFNITFQQFLNNLFKAVLKCSLSKLLLSMSLLYSDWSDVPVCCDLSTASNTCWKYTAIDTVPYFQLLDRNKHLLFIIACDSVEPAGPNKLGTEPSFKSKRFMNPAMNSPRLEKQSLVKLRVWEHSQPAKKTFVCIMQRKIFKRYLCFCL